MMLAIREEEGGPKIRPDLLLNLDDTQFRAFNQTPECLTTKEAKQELAAVRRGVAVTRDQEKARYARLLPLVSGNGDLVCVVAVVTDDTLKKPTLTTVSEILQKK